MIRQPEADNGKRMMRSNHYRNVSIAILLAIFWALIGVPADLRAAEDCAALARQVGHGGVLWTENAVLVQGTAAPHLGDPNTPLSVIKRMTQSAATLDAYRKAAGILTGIRISSQAMAVDNPQVMARIDAFVQKARVCDTKYYADGGVDIVVMVPLSGAFAMAQLPEAGTRVAAGPSDHTGLLVDARHLGFAPAIMPRLISTSGSVLMDASMVKVEVIQNRCPVRFLASDSSIPDDLLGPRPMKTKAMALGLDSPSDLVLDDEAAAVLSAGPSFIGDGRVVILVKPPKTLDCRQLAEAVADRHVDWEKKLVLARGHGRVDFSKDEDVSVRMRKMERAAEVDAQRKLLETFLAIGVDGSRTVKSLPAAAERVRGVVLNAVPCGAKYFKDGSAEVVMAAPLNAMAAFGAELGRTGAAANPMGTTGPTGLIVDASGSGFAPVLAPRIVSADGRQLYGPAVATRSYVRDDGLVGYCATLAEAQRNERVGTRPLVVKAVPSASAGRGEIRLDAQAEQSVASLAGQTAVLSTGRVVIVTEKTGSLSPTAVTEAGTPGPVAPDPAPVAPSSQGSSRVKVQKLDIP